MAIRRSGPAKPPPNTRRANAKSVKASARVKAKLDRANADLSEAGLPLAGPQDRPAPSAPSEAGLGRALLQLEAEVKRLDQELGRLLELFAASESEAKLWVRLKAQRKRLDDARRRWNRVRRRRHELSAAFRNAPLDPALASRLASFEGAGSAGARFESISARLSELLSHPEPPKARRSSKSNSGPGAHTVLAELAVAMIDLLHSGEPES